MQPGRRLRGFKARLFAYAIGFYPGLCGPSQILRLTSQVIPPECPMTSNLVAPCNSAATLSPLLKSLSGPTVTSPLRRLRIFRCRTYRNADAVHRRTQSRLRLSPGFVESPESIHENRIVKVVSRKRVFVHPKEENPVRKFSGNLKSTSKGVIYNWPQNCVGLSKKWFRLVQIINYFTQFPCCVHEFMAHNSSLDR